MKERHSFLCPEYYPAFSCKMGACRTACCSGWPISFSLGDYFHLQSLECSAELRDKLDRGIRVSLNPTPESYAQFAPCYDGNCYMRLADGRCSIHAELGEDALTDVCRLYPRGARSGDGYEISCANSCEAVPELLFKQEAPLQFILQELEIKMPPQGSRRNVFKTLGHGSEIRLWFIRQMQDRTLSIPQRLIALERKMRLAEDVLEREDEAGLLELLNKDADETRPPEVSVTRQHLQNGIETAERLLELIDRRSNSVREYGEEALRYFGSGEDAFERYEAARAGFEQSFPRWEIYFEHLLVNHMFFSEFPFQDRPENFHEEFVALCIVYTLLRFLSIGWIGPSAGTDGQHMQNGFIDVCSAAFRLIEHTDFDHSAIRMLKQIGADSLTQLHEWIIL